MKLSSIITVLIGAAAFTAATRLFLDSPKKCNSTIVILNGPSASGKSSMQREFTKLYAKPWLQIGIDNFFVGVIPQHLLTNPTTLHEDVMKGISSVDEQGKPVFNLEIYERGKKIIDGMHNAIAAYAQAGNNIIVDYIAYDPSWLSELAPLLKECTVYLIGIKMPLEILEQREKQRGTSPIGHARSHYETVHAGITYDLELDTSVLTAQQAAQKIKEFIEHNPEPTAIKKLLRK